MTSISCASSVSAKKSPKSEAENSKSCDNSVCTSNSSCFFKRRKPMNPLAYSMRPAYHKTNTNTVKQRVMSAKLLKLRQLQSQLNDANFHLAEVARENQVLKTLQHRQDKALSKYENTKADLPRLLHSHEEEIRNLAERNKHLRRSVKELTEQLKQKEEDLSKAREQLSHLEKLNKDKHLTERGKLMEKMEDLNVKLQKSDEQVTVLNRKLILESKISKQRLNSEMVKHKQCQKELIHALEEIDKLASLLEVKENTVRPRKPQFSKLSNRDSISMVTLRGYHGPNRNFSNEKLGTIKDFHNPVTDVKLAPINGTKEDKNGGHGDIFKTPMENIKQRLSSGSQKSNDATLSNNSSEVSLESRETSAESFKSRPNSSLKLEKLPVVVENRKIKAKMKDREYNNRIGSDSGSEEQNLEGGVDETEYKLKEEDDVSTKMEDDNRVTIHQRFDSSEYKLKENRPEDTSDEETPNFSQKNSKNHLNESKSSLKRNYPEKSDGSESNSEETLTKLTETLDSAIQRATEHSKEEFDKKLGNYCSEVMGSVRNCNKVIEVHKDSLRTSLKDTDTLLETLKNTERVENKLKNSFFNMDDTDMSFVTEILNEEYKFKSETDQNKNIKNKESLVNLDSKKKLLATLRAIDNGDSVDNLEEQKQGGVIREIFGN